MKSRGIGDEPAQPLLLPLLLLLLLLPSLLLVGSACLALTVVRRAGTCRDVARDQQGYIWQALQAEEGAAGLGPNEISFGAFRQLVSRLLYQVPTGRLLRRPDAQPTGTTGPAC